MSRLRRIVTLLVKDFKFESRSFMFIWALAMPLFLSLVLGLLFGSIFSDKPRMGVVDTGGSSVGAAVKALNHIVVQSYESETALLEVMQTGGVEVGLVLPANFDADLKAGKLTDVPLYVWGQSLIKNRAIVSAAISEVLLDQSGRATPVAVNVVQVGDRTAMSWQQRLLPMVVLMSIVLGGMLVPASSMIEERRRRTMYALTITPMTLGEVLFTKGLIGVILAVFCGILTLTVNGGWGTQPVLLLVVIATGATLASSFGLLIGSRVKDMQTLLAVIKGMGILLYAPGLLAIFPDIPQWISRVFPTYYIMQPVLDISQKGATLTDILPDYTILIALTALLIIGLMTAAPRLQVIEA
jgi:ABC-2 type transport system permease protein